MKATVVETRGDRSVVLASDGSFREVRGAYRIGEEIEYREVKRRWYYSAVALAAAFLIFFSGFTFFDHNYKVYATVEMKGDADIEYSLNGKDEIVKIKALNTKSEDIVDELKKDGIEKRVYIDEGIRRTKKVIRKRKKASRIVAKLVVEYRYGYPMYQGRPWSRELRRAKKKNAGEEKTEITPEDEEEYDEEGEASATENDGSEYEDINGGGPVDGQDTTPAEESPEENPDTSLSSDTEE